MSTTLFTTKAPTGATSAPRTTTPRRKAVERLGLRNPAEPVDLSLAHTEISEMNSILGQCTTACLFSRRWRLREAAMKVVELPNAGQSQPDMHNIPLLLRRLAECIERGEYGDFKSPGFIARCVCVLRVSGQEPIVLGFGATANGAQAYMDLHAGAHELMGMRGMER